MQLKVNTVSISRSANTSCRNTKALGT